MDGALFFARLALAGVFFLAAVAKLADRPGTGRALVGFGVPEGLARPGALALPLAELAVAGALVPTATARVGAVGALVLLSVFVVAIAVNLAGGRRPDCHCFGQLHSTPIGAATLGRNAALGAAAALVVAAGPGAGVGSALRWVGDLSAVGRVGLATGVGLCLVVSLQGWLVSNLVRQNGRILLRLDALDGKGKAHPVADGLPVGVAAPSFALTDLAGEPVSMGDLWAQGRPVLFVFVDPRCASCKPLLPEIATWREEHAEMAVALISGGSAKANQAIAGALLQADGEVTDAYRVAGTPSALVVRPDGRIGSRVVTGADAIRGLLAQARNGGKPPPPPEPLPDPPGLGEAAPDFTLPGVYGRPVDLARFRGQELVLLFWSPSCGFCQKMAPDLKAWEANRPPGAPQVLIVSSDTPEANREMGLRSPIVLQEHFAVGRRFGADGTPSAILLDADGNIASEPVVGAPHVLGLLRYRPATR